jgi:hypothetical protein
MSDRTELPIAWEVCGFVAEKPFVDGYKPECHRERFTNKADADQRKAELQSDGWVATAVPVFLSRRARTAAPRPRYGPGDHPAVSRGNRSTAPGGRERSGPDGKCHVAGEHSNPAVRT